MQRHKESANGQLGGRFTKILAVGVIWTKPGSVQEDLPQLSDAVCYQEILKTKNHLFPMKYVAFYDDAALEAEING